MVRIRAWYYALKPTSGLKGAPSRERHVFLVVLCQVGWVLNAEAELAEAVLFGAILVVAGVGVVVVRSAVAELVAGEDFTANVKAYRERTDRHAEPGCHSE